MVQLDFDLAPTCMAMFCQAIQQNRVVLLRRIEVSVDEWPAVVVSPWIDYGRVCTAPVLQSPLLFTEICMHFATARHNGGLEVIGKAKDEVERSE